MAGLREMLEAIEHGNAEELDKLTIVTKDYLAASKTFQYLLTKIRKHSPVPGRFQDTDALQHDLKVLEGLESEVSALPPDEWGVIVKEALAFSKENIATRLRMREQDLERRRLTIMTAMVRSAIPVLNYERGDEKDLGECMNKIIEIERDFLARSEILSRPGNEDLLAVTRQDVEMRELREALLEAKETKGCMR